jgi:hypothetical protein
MIPSRDSLKPNNAIVNTANQHLSGGFGSTLAGSGCHTLLTDDTDRRESGKRAEPSSKT